MAALAPNQNAAALGPHVHGTGRLQLVLEDGQVYAEFHIPAHDVVGFEDPPQSPDEQAAVAAAAALLQDPANVLSVPQTGQCKAQAGEVNSGMLRPLAGQALESSRQEQAADGAGVDEDDDDDDDEAHAEQGGHHHMEFEAIYRYTCEHLESIDYLEVPLISRLPQLQHLDVEWVTADAQRSIRLDAPQGRVELK